MKQTLSFTGLCLLLSIGLHAQQTSFPKKDSTEKQSRWFITTYPSSVLLGDLSLGAEFSYKRIRQELALFYKTYNIWSDYLYDKGSGINYYLKYDLIKREDLHLSLDIGYVYRKAYYDNKVIPLMLSEQGLPLNYYNTDRNFRKSGLSLGGSTLIKLKDRFFLGFNACIDLVMYENAYVIKEYISGTKLMLPEDPDAELLLPFISQKRGKGFSATVLVKLAYRL